VEHGLAADGRLASIAERMAHYHVPAVSVAVAHNGLFKWARGFGVAEAGGSSGITERTLFQAASISKAVTAMAALRLVQDGKLVLDCTTRFSRAS